MEVVKKRSKKQKAAEEKDCSTSSVSPRKVLKRQAKEKSMEKKDSSTSSVSPRKAPKRQAKEKSTQEKDSSTSSVSPRKVPKRQAKEKSTEEKDSSTTLSMVREGLKRQAEKSITENGESSSKSPRKSAAKRQTKRTGDKAARKTKEQTETSMEKPKTRKTSGTSKQGGGDEPDAADKDSLSSTIPAIYQVQNMTYDVRFDELFNSAIACCKPFEVECSFSYYIKDNVQGDDWQAVWSSHQLGCDILVEVTDVCFPHAKIELVEPFCCQLNSLGHPGGDGQQLKTKEEVINVLSGKDSKVFLLELFPVHGNSGNFKKTAEALELYRFFYSYIWRASDVNDCGDYEFAVYNLEPRMQIYYDVQKKKVSEAVQQTYTNTMSEYQKKYMHFKIRRTEVFGDGDDDEKEEEEEKGPDEELYKLWADVCRLEDILTKLEDPVMREHCQVRANNAVVTHLVAHEFTLQLIKTADIDKDATIEQHKTLASALESCFNGDTIIIFPGTYSGEGVTNITKDITIKGAEKNPSDVVITYEEKSLELACLECSGFMIEIENITFEGKPQGSPFSFASLMVSKGRTLVTNCVFKSFTGGIRVSKDGKLQLDKCQIYDISTSGVAVIECGALGVADSHIHHCGGKSREDKKTSTSKKSAMNNAGVCIQASEWGRAPNETRVCLTGNKIEDTGGPAVWIEVTTSDMKDRSKPKNLKTLDNVRDKLMFVGLDWFASGKHTFKNNESGPVRIQYKKQPKSWILVQAL